MESHQATVVLSKEIIQNAARCFMWRFIFRSSFFDLVAVALMIILGMTDLLGRELTMIGIIAGLALLGMILLVAFKYVRLAKTKFAAMSDPHITYTCTADTFGAKSSLGDAEVPWKLITKIWKFDDVWLLFFGDHSYSTLPITLLPSELSTFVEERVIANGGKVS